MSNQVAVKILGVTDYKEALTAMQSHNHDPTSPDEIWITEHLPVFTLGQSAEPPADMKIADIPVIRTDRGGQITYHGPGQLIIYPLINLKRNQLMPLDMVSILEKVAIEWLKEFGIDGVADSKNRGIYVNGKKIASIGIRIKNGRSYHGIAINLQMDLSPFESIDPCGIKGMEMAQTYDIIGKNIGINEIKTIVLKLADRLHMDINQMIWVSDNDRSITKNKITW
tara:strand:- start:742 stop:1416 length:675 start_codon:yes stop_codon:yes gene_type:complete